MLDDMPKPAQPTRRLREIRLLCLEIRDMLLPISTTGLLAAMPQYELLAAPPDKRTFSSLRRHSLRQTAPHKRSRNHVMQNNNVTVQTHTRPPTRLPTRSFATRASAKCLRTPTRMWPYQSNTYATCNTCRREDVGLDPETILLKWVPFGCQQKLTVLLYKA